MPKANAKFTLVDYLNLPESPRYKLIEGELLLTPSPTYRHQAISRNIGAALWTWVKESGLGTVVHAPPITKERDLTLKRRRYARHGIREFWIVDGDRRTIEVNEWTPEGYRPVGLFAWSDTLHSPLLPGFELPVGSALEDL